MQQQSTQQRARRASLHFQDEPDGSVGCTQKRPISGMHARRGSLHIFWLSLIESSGPSHDDVWSRSKNGVLHTYWNSPFHRQLLFNQLYLHKTGHYQFIPANPAFNSNRVRRHQLTGIHNQKDMEKDWLGQITIGPNSLFHRLNLIIRSLQDNCNFNQLLINKEHSLISCRGWVNHNAKVSSRQSLKRIRKDRIWQNIKTMLYDFNSLLISFENCIPLGDSLFFCWLKMTTAAAIARMMTYLRYCSLFIYPACWWSLLALVNCHQCSTKLSEGLSIGLGPARTPAPSAQPQKCRKRF